MTLPNTITVIQANYKRKYINLCLFKYYIAGDIRRLYMQALQRSSVVIKRSLITHLSMIGGKMNANYTVYPVYRSTI